MSYDISLHDPVTREVIELDGPHDMRGGTYCVGGTRDMVSCRNRAHRRGWRLASGRGAA